MKVQEGNLLSHVLKLYLDIRVFHALLILKRADMILSVHTGFRYVAMSRILFLLNLYRVVS